MSHIPRRWTARFIALALAVTSLLSVGCSGTGLWALRANPSPELATPGQSQGQVSNHVAITEDNLLRSAYEDLLRAALLTDRHYASYTPSP